MSAHTPGPWKAIRDPCHYDTLSTVIGGLHEKRRGLEHQLIVQVGGWDVDQQEANTRLIAAAPELLEALEAVMAILPACPKNTGIAGIEARYNFAVVGARAAIAKAIGGAA